jgi:DNA-binding NarL/FixJ family response regulator
VCDVEVLCRRRGADLVDLGWTAGYVLKQVGSLDLVDAVRRAGNGQSLLDPSLTERVLERLRERPKVDPRLPRSRHRSGASST